MQQDSRISGFEHQKHFCINNIGTVLLPITTASHSTDPGRPHSSTAAHVLEQSRHTVVGMSDSSPQSLATDAPGHGTASKQWKVMESYIPATKSLVCPQPIRLSADEKIT
ncbi:hypothetical protein E2C01_026368 [Portunus trituberculatus]|uniref:Uncharacterized protein n=1 Tax=Portunus trituberculatus TaxID=210409 RepID=A0A5B7EIN7_PORTR|nr:hypothetical protein [Portunus trituberculatus]